MKAVIIYHSKTGTTKKFAEEIAAYLKMKKIEVAIASTRDYGKEILENADYLLLGCWTHGLIFFMQHPEKEWVDFASRLPENLTSNIALFTTYKVRTGSMFRKMDAHIPYHSRGFLPMLKSRDGSLSENDMSVLDQFIHEAA